MLFSTSHFDSKGSVQFMTADKDSSGKARYSLPMRTAARLSATFPYVTPAARALEDEPVAFTEHCVDGGYFDNYGVRPLAHWLEDGFREREKDSDSAPLEILVLELIGLPDAPPNRQRRRLKGWTFQVFAPLQTLFGAALGSQGVRNDDYMRQFRGHWEKRCKNLSIRYLPVSFKLQDYEFKTRDYESIPLNWRLTRDDQRRIEESWEEQKDELGHTIAEFLDAGEELMEPKRLDRRVAC